MTPDQPCAITSDFAGGPGEKAVALICAYASQSSIVGELDNSPQARAFANEGRWWVCLARQRSWGPCQRRAQCRCGHRLASLCQNGRLSSERNGGQNAHKLTGGMVRKPGRRAMQPWGFRARILAPPHDLGAFAPNARSQFSAASLSGNVIEVNPRFDATWAPNPVTVGGLPITATFG